MYGSPTQNMTVKAAPPACRAGVRLRRTVERMADRALIAAPVAALAISPTVLGGVKPGCLLRLALWFVVVAAVASLALQPATRFRRFAVAAERGISSIEVLVTAALVSLLIVGVAYEFGHQHASVTNEANAEALRDVGSAIDVDAAAIAAYDANARAAYTALAQQNTTLTVNGQTAKIKLNGATSGLAVSVTTPDGSQANLLAPLPDAKPTPQ
jgi:type II secretory pathway pseudopilin PulG